MLKPTKTIQLVNRNIKIYFYTYWLKEHLIWDGYILKHGF